MLTRYDGRSLRALTGVGALALILFAAPLAAQVPTKALDCNSEIQILLGAPTPAPGGASDVPVTLTVINRLSNDLFDNPVAQDFQQVVFDGSCITTGPCMPDGAMPFTYLTGSYNPGAPDACPGNIGITPMAGNTVFDFGPPGVGFTLGPADALGNCTPGTACDCTVDFVYRLAAGATPVPPNTGFPLEATTSGVCDITPIGGFTSSASATTILMPIPTMGQAALLTLVLLLLVGAASILRRRSGGLAEV